MIVEKIMAAQEAKIKETDLSYAAGIIDGEGSIVIYKRPAYRKKNQGGYFPLNPMHELIVSAGMTDRKVIYWLNDLFGGSVCVVKARRHEYRKFWKWSITGQKANEFLKAISPFLKTKSLQAILADNLQQSKKQFIKGGAGGTKKLPNDIILYRDNIMATNKVLNSGYDPEFMGGYYDC